MCDTIYEAESTYILSDFKNALIYNDHCAVRRISIVAGLPEQLSRDTLLSNSASNFVSTAFKDSPARVARSERVRFQRRLNDQARSDRRLNDIELNASGYSSSKSDNR